LLGWTLLSWAGYSYAGEKMPWLVVHIVLPSVFLAAWALGKLIAGVDWRQFVREHGWLIPISVSLAMAALFVFSRATVDLRAAMQTGVTSAGPSLVQLEPFGKLIGGLLGVLAFGGLFVWISARFSFGWVARVMGLLLAAFLALFTARDMVRLNFVTYDLATEMMVYAHGTPDIKVALKQVQDVSWRVTGSPYDTSRWPMARAARGR